MTFMLCKYVKPMSYLSQESVSQSTMSFFQAQKCKFHSHINRPKYRCMFCSDIHDKHISAFLVQLLDQVGLSQSWKDIIESLAIKVCEMVSRNELVFTTYLLHSCQRRSSPNPLPQHFYENHSLYNFRETF